MHHNVLIYGADPSGQRDSTDAFRRALESWMVSSAGGAVLVPAGTYRLSGSLCGAEPCTEAPIIEGQEGGDI